MYIRQDKLPRLKEYKYSGVDHSYVSRYILKPFYTNVVIHFFPMWMAPNLITLSGFGFVIINFLTLLWYNPTLDQDCPSWVYISWAIGLFLYQTFDAVDGTQARRTKQSGPLGELFDHGVDALNTALEVLLFAGGMNMGQGWKTVMVLFATTFTFYVQTWEEYHTHTLTLGVISGPVEGILTLCTVYAITAFVGGGSFWQAPMLPYLGLKQRPSILPERLYDFSWNEWWMVYGGIVLIFNTLDASKNVAAARRSRNQAAGPAILGLVPILTAWVLIPTYLFFHPTILYHHLIPFVFFVGLLNAYSVGRIIVAHLVKQGFPKTNILIAPLIFGVADSLGPAVGKLTGGKISWASVLADGQYQVAFVFLCLGLAMGVYGSFVVDVILAICDYLDIWCLTIKHPHNPAEETEKKGR